MYPATFWKCRSEASKMLPVNLRMSCEYSDSCRRVGRPVSNRPAWRKRRTHHIQQLLIVGRHGQIVLLKKSM